MNSDMRDAAAALTGGEDDVSVTGLRRKRIGRAAVSSFRRRLVAKRIAKHFPVAAPRRAFVAGDGRVERVAIRIHRRAIDAGRVFAVVPKHDNSSVVQP